ncbi:hypothetical protein AVEN_198843-1 [Araneus ventricosus]|uniref:Uncharacterized protein n=1 Tax=Araneus ventricosus TaxID=182803 RepID=A0A4Y2JGC5_ARAVE|nr:hypothetical protein AVEN_198843-1 [Araneus ventricosus]
MMRRRKNNIIPRVSLTLPTALVEPNTPSTPLNKFFASGLRTFRLVGVYVHCVDFRDKNGLTEHPAPKGPSPDSFLYMHCKDLLYGCSKKSNVQPNMIPWVEVRGRPLWPERPEEGSRR